MASTPVTVPVTLTRAEPHREGDILRPEHWNRIDGDLAVHAKPGVTVVLVDETTLDDRYGRTAGAVGLFTAACGAAAVSRTPLSRRRLLFPWRG